MEDPRLGGYLKAIPQRAIPWSVETLVRDVPLEKLLKLKVRSGEHLAAILCTAFFGYAPDEIDDDGGVDLRFSGDALHDVPGGSTESHAFSSFEVKSMPGGFRQYEAQAGKTTPDATGTHAVTVETAANVLARAQQTLNAATQQLLRKAGSTSSRNIFLIVHPFDALAVEAIEDPPIAQLLPAISLHTDIYSLWVLWIPDHLTVYLREQAQWVDLIFAAMGPNEQPLAKDMLTLLQEADLEFLHLTGQSESPFVYGLTVAEPDSDD